MCFEAICLRRFRGREDKCCCCCSTWIGMHLLAVCNWFIFICTLLNIIRILKITAGDVAIWFGLIIAGSRCYFQLFLCVCCDGIRSRRNFMYCMNLTTFFETIIFFIQWLVLVKRHSEYVCTDDRLPTFNMDPSTSKGCRSILSYIFTANSVYLFCYFYFCCVTYEHYFRGCKNPVFLLAEAKRAKKA